MKVLVTGGAGFLGRGILRQVQRGELDWQVTVMSRDEAKHIKIRQRFPETTIVRGDVSGDVESLTRLFAGHEVVIHAGANKLVDIGETAAFEIMRNNIVGSEHVAKAAMNAGVRQVVGLSSDKAVQPVNMYGMSKAVMERLFQEADGLSNTAFTCARYGNIVGSTISIMLYFQEQLAKEGKLLVTVPEMTRFYMGVDEAIAAIHLALAAERGTVVISKMQAMSVGDVACLVLGLERGTDITKDDRVVVTGARPGEKLHEFLLHEQESVRVKPTPDDEAADAFELRPAPTPSCRAQPFTLTSSAPPLGWMSFERLQGLVEDASHV